MCRSKGDGADLPCPVDGREPVDGRDICSWLIWVRSVGSSEGFLLTSRGASRLASRPLYDGCSEGGIGLSDVEGIGPGPLDGGAFERAPGCAGGAGGPLDGGPLERPPGCVGGAGGPLDDGPLEGPPGCAGCPGCADCPCLARICRSLSSKPMRLGTFPLVYFL